jgi:uncharacterized membrane protein
MDPFLFWLEHTPYSLWVRESITLWAFPFMLILHAIGMGFLAGIHTSMSLRILGVAKGIPPKAMQSYFPFLWLGLVINVFSGVSLLIAYPTKALTNPLFYLKLALIAAALYTLRWTQKNVLSRDTWPPATAWVATLSIVFWLGAIFAGRLLAYTYSKLMSGEGVS